MIWGGRCPQCKQPFRGLQDGVTMGVHRTEFNAPFSNRRERCPYSRSTVSDAMRGISPLMRRTQLFVIGEIQTGKPLSTKMAYRLEQLGLLEETLVTAGVGEEVIRDGR